MTFANLVKYREEHERIAKENPNIFMTREDILSKMNIPKNTSKLVVVMSNNKGTGFLRNTYDKRYLKKHISQEEFTKTIDYVSFIMKKLYSKKRNADAISGSCFNQF